MICPILMPMKPRLLRALALLLGLSLIEGSPAAGAALPREGVTPVPVASEGPGKIVFVTGVRYFKPSYLNLRRGDWTSDLTNRSMEDFVPSMNGAYGGLGLFVDRNNAFYAMGAYYQKRVNIVFDREVVGPPPARTIVHTLTQAHAWSVEVDWRHYRDRTTRFRPYFGLGLAYGEVKTNLDAVGSKFLGLPSYTVGLLLKPVPRLPGLSIDLNLKTDTLFVVPMNGTAAGGLTLWFGAR